MAAAQPAAGAQEAGQALMVNLVMTVLPVPLPRLAPPPGPEALARLTGGVTGIQHLYTLEVMQVQVRQAPMDPLPVG